ncbi:ABC transporter permease [Bacillus sp. FSL W7-1294]
MLSTEHSMHHDETMKKRYLFIILIVLSVSSILEGVAKLK